MSKAANKLKIDVPTLPKALEYLVDEPRWVVWGIEQGNEKCPYSPITKNRAAVNNSDSWGTFEQAKKYASSEGGGIGLMLDATAGAAAPIVFDLDKCRDAKTGQLSDWAQQIVNSTGGLVEVSPSGTGLHIFGGGDAGPIHQTVPQPGEGELEIFSQTRRYITITGTTLGKVPESLPDISDVATRYARAQSLTEASQSPNSKLAQRLADLGKGINWHNNMRDSVAALVHHGLHDDAIQVIVENYRDTENYTQTETRKEVQAAIDGARNKGFGPNTFGEHFTQEYSPKLLTLDELENEQLPEQLIKNILPEGPGVAILGGQSGHGKSFLAVLFALHVALGMDIGPNEVKQGGVIYAANEGQAGLSQRFSAVEEYFSHDRPSNLRVLKTTPDLSAPATLQAFCDEMGELDFPISLIIIDTLSKATIGTDENSVKDVAQYMQNANGLAQTTGALVLLIDHVGKDTNKGLRGSSAKHANADMIGILSKTKGSNLLTLKTKKQKDFEDGMIFKFELKTTTIERHGVTHEVPVAVPCGDRFRFRQPDFIMFQLDSHNGEMERQELTDAFLGEFGEDKKKNCHAQLKRLKEKGGLDYDRDKVWAQNDEGE